MDTTLPELQHFESAGEPSYTFGLVGLIVSILGLILAVARPHVDDAVAPPPMPAKIGDRVVDAADKFVGRMIDRAKGQPAAPARALPWQWYLAVAGPALGLIGALGGLVGWVRHELPRPTIAAMVIGFLAVAWVYLLVALVITLVIVAVVLILGHIG